MVGNLLRLNLKEGKYDRNLFLEYLSLPRQAPELRDGTHSQSTGDAGRPQLCDESASHSATGWRRSNAHSQLLEYFFQSENKVDDFARFLERNYLEKVLAETKILYGDEDAATWYGQTQPGRTEGAARAYRVALWAHAIKLTSPLMMKPSYR